MTDHQNDGKTNEQPEKLPNEQPEKQPPTIRVALDRNGGCQISRIEDETEGPVETVNLTRVEAFNRHGRRPAQQSPFPMIDQDTLGQHVVVYWLRVLREIAASVKRLKAEGSVIPPEFARQRRNAVRYYADASIGVHFRTFEGACDWAVDCAMGNAPKAVGIVRFTGSMVGKEDTTEYGVYPLDQIPLTPSYITTEVIAVHRFDNQASA